MSTDALINVNGGNVQALDIMLLLTVITLLPSLVVMMTSFTRYVVSFSFLRTAMGTQQTPPNTVLVGMALILTLFTMTPTLNSIKTDAYDPYTQGTIDQEEFFQRAQVPIKDYMLRQTEISSMALYCEMLDMEVPETEEEAGELPLQVIMPAFVTSELKEAFAIGFLLYIPFMLIDIIVSSTLMILLFIMLDGWHLLFSSLVRGINW